MIVSRRARISASLVVAGVLMMGAAHAQTPVSAAVKSTVSAKSVKPALGSAAGLSAFSLTNLPEVLANAQNSNSLKVLKEFPTPGGLQGWVIKEGREGKEVIIYTSADGKILIAGMLMDARGENLTAKFGEQHISKPDYTPAFNAFQKDAHSVLVGEAKAPAEITVLFDLNCGYCKIFHRLVQPAIAAGELRVRYIPVGILGPTSVDKAAALMHSKDPFGFINAVAASGSAGGVDALAKEFVPKVQANTELMKRMGFNGTPAVLYKAKQGDTLVVSTGLPAILGMFSQLGISGQVDKLRGQQDLEGYLR